VDKIAKLSRAKQKRPAGEMDSVLPFELLMNWQTRHCANSRAMHCAAMRVPVKIVLSRRPCAARSARRCIHGIVKEARGSAAIHGDFSLIGKKGLVSKIALRRQVRPLLCKRFHERVMEYRHGSYFCAFVVWSEMLERTCCRISYVWPRCLSEEEI
jgi:hypothetical protein